MTGKQFETVVDLLTKILHQLTKLTIKKNKNR